MMNRLKMFPRICQNCLRGNREYAIIQAYMNNFFGFVKRRKYYLLTAVVVVILIFLFSAGGNDKLQSYVVQRGNVEQSVILSGDVRTSNRADLGFAAAGRIGKIYVKNNQEVRQGQVLAQLEIGDLLADLKIKEVNAKTSDVDLEKAREDLVRVTAQENAKVDSAYRTLLSEGLELTPDSLDYSVDAPTVNGAYNGSEGTYKVVVTKENPTFSDLYLRTFQMEKTEIEVNEGKPTPLGSRGLYVSFPDTLSSYNDTIWYLEIPNKSSSYYFSNLNAYNEAKENRDRAVKTAELEYQKLLTEKSGEESLVAQAEIDKIKAEIRKNTIYAPFSGKVTNLEKEVGENASAGERIISILGEEKLEVVLQVSELDVSKLVPGHFVSIYLDAFPEEEFSGVLETVNSKETDIEGVPVYEAFVELPADERIRTGMNAEAEIVLAERKDVLYIPSRFIKKAEENKVTVDVVLKDGKIQEREVMLGIKGTDGLVEILSGLSLGEKVGVEAPSN